MKRIRFFAISTVLLVALVTGWASMGQAFYAPYFTTAWSEGTTMHYKVYDVVSDSEIEDTWTLSEGDEAYIESIQVDSGIVGWIAKYRYHGESEWNWAVQYRVYDPYRGKWQKGFGGIDELGWFQEGYHRDFHRLKVKDGVVAWVTHHQIGEDPGDYNRHSVNYVTFDPIDGTWKFDQDLSQYVRGSECRPLLLQVKDGIVAWGEPCMDDQSPVYVRIYDYELHRWAKGQRSWFLPMRDLDEIEINAGRVHAQSGFWFGPDYHNFFVYDHYNHRWNEEADDGDLVGDWDWPDPIPKASFIAQPLSGTVPFWVVFWDTSYAIYNGSWSWDFGNGSSSSDRSPLNLYDSTGTYGATLTANSPPFGQYIATANIQANEPVVPEPPPPPPPPEPPTGSISINGGAAYTPSLNIVLNLKASASATEMCFRQEPIPLPYWSPWEPYAPEKSRRLFPQYTLPDWNPDRTYWIIVKFRDANGAESQEYSDSIILDTTPPTGTVTIARGAACTNNPTVPVWFTAAGADEMSWGFQDGSGPIFWTLWGPFKPSVTTSVGPGDGEKYVYVAYRDGAGNSTHQYDRIILDTAPPQAGVVTAAPGDKAIQLTWKDFADAMGGITGYDLFYSTQSYPTPSSGQKIYEGSDTSFTHRGLENGQTYYYSLYARDCAGNVSLPAQALGEPRGDSGIFFTIKNKKTGKIAVIYID